MKPQSHRKLHSIMPSLSLEVCIKAHDRLCYSCQAVEPSNPRPAKYSALIKLKIPQQRDLQKPLKLNDIDKIGRRKPFCKKNQLTKEIQISVECVVKQEIFDIRFHTIVLVLLVQLISVFCAICLTNKITDLTWKLFCKNNIFIFVTQFHKMGKFLCFTMK